MTNQTKWELRQIAMTYLSMFFSPTVWLLYFVIIKAWKFKGFGHEMGLKVMQTKGWTLAQLIHQWYAEAISPYIWWIPLVLFLEIILRRYAIRFD